MSAKRLWPAIGLACAATLVTGTLVTVLGSMIGFYDWMWLLVIVGAGLGFGCALITDLDV